MTYQSNVTPKGNRATFFVSMEDAENVARLMDENGCVNCTNCINCINCINCRNCNYCRKCTDCTNCTYNIDCTNCTYCNYSNDCTYCAYCTDCIDCTNCTYCTNCINCDESSKPLHVYLPPWNVNIYKTGKIKIGCQSHATQEWENFTDSEIARMSPVALEFWDKNKNIIISLAKIYQTEQ